MKKWISVLLALVMVLTVVPAFAAKQEVTYRADFSGEQLFADPALYFSLQENFKLEGGSLMCDENNWAALGTKSPLAPPYSANATFSTNYQAKSSAIECLAVGIRVPEMGNLLIDKGIWLLVRSSSVCFMINNESGNMISVPMSISFGEEHSLYIEDDGDEIRYLVEGRQDSKQMVARVAIEEDGIKVYDGDDVFCGSSQQTVLDQGHYRLMTHFSNTAISAFGYTHEEDVYVPVGDVEVRDTYADTWVATDDLGRSLPTYEEVGPVNSSKSVGMFYFLWHDATSGEIYDHTKAYNEGGADAVYNLIPQGNIGFGHYWAEPYFGYYRSDDEWVVRKHAEMLADAGVDYIFFDNSNGVTYPTAHFTVLNTFCDILAEGGKAPKVVFFLGDNPELGKRVMDEIWPTIYRDGKYKELWYMWDGKPLILGNLSQVDPAIKETFTVRNSWAYNEWIGDGINKWPWIADYPQLPGKDPAGNIEQMTVSVGRGGIDDHTPTRGRSYANGVQPVSGKPFNFELEETPYGLRAKEQWEYAIEMDPATVMVTGWNEWWAGRWEDTAGIKQQLAAEYMADPSDPVKKNYYVDSFNTEYSRDIEPMRGGFGDSYYYQLVDYIRQFKGVRPIPVAEGQKTIDIAGAFDQWTTVGPEYRDTIYDTSHRNHLSFTHKLTYVNESGRNDLAMAKVSRDDNYVYFYIEAMEALTAPEGKNWMNLYVNTDNSFETGWKGYDLLINRTQNGKVASVEKNAGGYTWEKVGEAAYKTEGNKLMLQVEKSLIPEDSFEFKWADNSVQSDDVMQFLDQGDAAPDARFNFKYITTPQNFTVTAKHVVGNNSVAMVLDRSTALINGAPAQIDENDANIKPVVKNDRTLVPLRFVSQAFGAQVEWDAASQMVTVKNRDNTICFLIGEAIIEINGEVSDLDVAPEIMYDRTFIPLRAMAEALNKEVLWNDSLRLIVISGQPVTAAQEDLQLVADAIK